MTVPVRSKLVFGVVQAFDPSSRRIRLFHGRILVLKKVTEKTTIVLELGVNQRG
jgi:hypothetical protein